MSHIATFVSPSGDEMVVVPASEYRRLADAVDMAEDIAIYDDVKRRIESGKEQMIPSAFVDRILDGENRIRVWREIRGLSPAELATAAAIPEAELARAESDEEGVTVATVRRLARALRLDVEDLIRR